VVGRQFTAEVQFFEEKGISHDDYVFIINDDVVFNKEFLAKGIAILEKEKKALLLSQFPSL